METLEKEIGEAAGKIWETLSENEAMSRSKLAKATALSTVLVNQGIGWLAREGKLTSINKNRIEMIALKE